MTVTEGEHPQVRAVMAACLDSFEKLELVLHLATRPEPVSLDGLARALGHPRDRMSEAAAGLVAALIIEESPAGYRFRPENPWAAHLQELVALHEADRLKVVVLMSTVALERLRASASRAFADAFVLRARRRKDDDG